MHDITTIIAFLLYIYICVCVYVFINDALQPYTLVRLIHQGLTYPTMQCEKSEHFHKSLAPNHVFGQMLGLPGSYVLVPYVLLYWLG